MTTLAAMTSPATHGPGDDTSSKYTLDTSTVRCSILTNTVFLYTPLGNVVLGRKIRCHWYLASYSTHNASTTMPVAAWKPCPRLSGFQRLCSNVQTSPFEKKKNNPTQPITGLTILRPRGGCGPGFLVSPPLARTIDPQWWFYIYSDIKKLHCMWHLKCLHLTPDN